MMTDIVERLRARLQRDRLGRFDPELSIVIGPGIYQDIMEAAGTVEGLRDERNAMRAEIERLRNDAQIVPTRDQIYGVVLKELETHHPIPTTNFFAGRIADAILALPSAERPQDHDPRCDCGHLFEICPQADCTAIKPLSLPQQDRQEAKP